MCTDDIRHAHDGHGDDHGDDRTDGTGHPAGNAEGCCYGGDGAAPDPASGNTASSGGPSRRHLLGLGAGLPLSVLVPGAAQATGRSLAAPGVVRTAMHVHSSFSEGGKPLERYGDRTTMASMHSQLDAMAALGIGYGFFTDHDHRMRSDDGGMGPRPYPQQEQLASPRWTWTPELIGSPASGSTALTSSGMTATVRAGTGEGAAVRLARSATTGRDYQASLAGTTISLTFVPGSSAGWTEMRLRASTRPATGGRPAGSYEVHYRFTHGSVPQRVSAKGRIAVVWVPPGSGAGLSRTVTVNPLQDLRAAFPDLGELTEDNGLYGLWLGVGAPAGTTASTTVVGVGFERERYLNVALARQQRLLDTLLPRYPQLRASVAIEASYSEHVTLFGRSISDVAVEPWRSGTSAAYLRSLTDSIHQRSGLSVYTHPFGATDGGLLSGTARARKITTVARRLLGAGLFGADMMEVGYTSRGSMDLAAHLQLWDILLAAGLRVGANGVSDDHGGTVASWRAKPNLYVSDVITSRGDVDSLLSALVANRSFVSFMGGYSGMLDLGSGATVMGGTVWDRARSLDLTLQASLIPSGGSLRAVQYAIHADPSRASIAAPLWSQTWSAGQVVGGTVGATVRNVRSYVRTEVRDSGGAVVAFSNPLWLNGR